jgi:acetylornithine deacetylase/succinyl-diaminopimelate desuccinylase-like protein
VITVSLLLALPPVHSPTVAKGKQMHYAHVLTPTCTINRLTSGEDATAPENHSIPATARAIVDFHLVPGQEPVDIFDKLKRHLCTRGFADIHVTLRDAGLPAYTPAHHSFVQQVVQSAERVYGQAPLILPVLPEHVPIQALTQNLSTPTIILPLYPPRNTKYAGTEWQNLCNGIALLTSIMLRYAQ